MTYFISGGAKCGKSTLAQNLTVALADGGKHYYVATMISSGKEDDDRIRRHIADRWIGNRWDLGTPCLAQ